MHSLMFRRMESMLKKEEECHRKQKLMQNHCCRQNRLREQWKKLKQLVRRYLKQQQKQPQHSCEHL